MVALADPSCSISWVSSGSDRSWLGLICSMNFERWMASERSFCSTGKGGSSLSPPPAAPSVRAGVSGMGILPALLGMSDRVSRGSVSLAADDTVERNRLCWSVGVGVSGGDTSENSNGSVTGLAASKLMSSACTASRNPGRSRSACSSTETAIPHRSVRSRRGCGLIAAMAVTLHPASARADRPRIRSPTRGCPESA